MMEITWFELFSFGLACFSLGWATYSLLIAMRGRK